VEEAEKKWRIAAAMDAGAPQLLVGALALGQSVKSINIGQCYWAQGWPQAKRPAA
jgi:hypothetical protein